MKFQLNLLKKMLEIKELANYKQIVRYCFSSIGENVVLQQLWPEIVNLIW